MGTTMAALTESVGPLYLKMTMEDLNSSQNKSCNLQALAAAFGVVTELQLQEEKCTADLKSALLALY